MRFLYPWQVIVTPQGNLWDTGTVLGAGSRVMGTVLKYLTRGLPVTNPNCSRVIL